MHSHICVSVIQLYRVLLIEESNQTRSCDVVGLTSGSRAMDVTEHIPGRAEMSRAHCGDCEDAICST